jgi:hypothetical protein
MQVIKIANNNNLLKTVVKVLTLLRSIDLKES